MPRLKLLLAVPVAGLLAVAVHRRREQLEHMFLELFAHLGDVVSHYQDRIADEGYLGSARVRSSVREAARSSASGNGAPSG